MTQFDVDVAKLEKMFADGNPPTEVEINALSAVKNTLDAQQIIDSMLDRLRKLTARVKPGSVPPV